METFLKNLDIVIENNPSESFELPPQYKIEEEKEKNFPFEKILSQLKGNTNYVNRKPQWDAIIYLTNNAGKIREKQIKEKQIVGNWNNEFENKLYVLEELQKRKIEQEIAKGTHIQDIETAKNYSVLSYFQDMEKKGRATLKAKVGEISIYNIEGKKFHIDEKENLFFDTEKELFGGILKAVIQFENKSFKDALTFIKNKLQEQNIATKIEKTKYNHQMQKYTPEDIERISNAVSVVDYFFHLEKKGLVTFDRKTNKDYYFRTKDNKFSVSERGFYDFKSGEGGQIVKAVMSIENKSWKEAIDFLKDFSGTEIERDITAKRAKIDREKPLNNTAKLTNVSVPNNEKLLEYFQGRGISREVLQNHTQQVHYEVGGKKYFGIGIKNASEGWEIRNPMVKTKIGHSDISVFPNSPKEILVFEGMTDMLSFLQLCQDSKKLNNRSVVVLNSVTNVDKFIAKFKNFEGKISLLLDGDKAGNEATLKIQQSFNDVRDLRDLYNISETLNNDLNDYLKEKKGLNNHIISSSDLENNISSRQDEFLNHMLEEIKNSPELTIKILQNPDTQNKNLALQSFFKEFRQAHRLEYLDLYKSTVTDKSIEEKLLFSLMEMVQDIEKNRNLAEKNNERNQEQSKGLPTPEPVGGRTSERNAGEPEQSGQSEQERNHRAGQNVVGNDAGNGLGASERLDVGRGRRMGRGRLPDLIDELKNKKVTNEQITEVVNLATSVAQNNTIQLNQEISENLLEDLRKIVTQYKSGGITKDINGILDEYYTDVHIVSAIGEILKNSFSNNQVKVLEPSVGIGNFLYSAKELNTSNINTFEINPTTAKITKILHPEATVNLRPFESEFSDDRGFKKDFSVDYDLVIGNPPYGEHRGEFKGLGEEENITKYEDYFVKRSLDVLKEGGLLAMVLPSSWLDKKKKLNGAELAHAYRLPQGAFKGTRVGTDIVFLKRNSKIKNLDISQYFNENENNILGKPEKKTNQWGDPEIVVVGNLQDALKKLTENLVTLPISITQNEEFIQGNLFQEFLFENQQEIDNSIENKKKSKALSLTIDKVNEALSALFNIKFRSVTVIEEINYFNKTLSNLEQENAIENYSLENLEEIQQKATNAIQRLERKQENKEYTHQTAPEIKKGVLKYQFHKIDNVVATGLQNSPNITPEALEAFKDTDYDGTLKNHEKHKDFANYHNGKWVHDFYYAEGNIYEKLSELERDKPNIVEFFGQEQYDKQKALLSKVLPPKKALEDIIISPNHEFVHQFSLGQEEKQVQVQTGWNPYGRTHIPRYEMEKRMVNVTLADKFKRFIVDLPYEAFGNSSSWEVRGFVDNEQVYGQDKNHNAIVRERRKEVANRLFNTFLRDELTPAEQKLFVDEFNRKHNNIHVPNYTQFPLFSKINENFKGKPLELTEVQKAGIGRQTTKGVGLLAHEVGFGKTLSGILSMHEAMERGNAKRPLIVVPNDAILKQWVETIFEAIPDAKVNVLGNMGKDYDLSKFDNKDGEITLVTYEGFNNIGFSEDVTRELAGKWGYVNEKDFKGIKHPSEREKAIALSQNNEIKGKMKRGKVYDWEDFGFDHLTFDEVHNANHIISKVSLDRKFASDFRSQNQKTSTLGINTWVACQYIQEKHNGRNVTLLSATPFTNKPLEYYSVLSLIASERLRKNGYENVNTFFETFMEADNDMEIDARGDVKYKTNVRRFKNNALFQQLLSEFVDIKGEEDNPELKRPNRINKEYQIEQNDFTKDMMQMQNDAFKETEEGAILTHILNARKTAISPYLSPFYKGAPPSSEDFVEHSPKLKTTMELITQNKKDRPEAGQIIYSELGVDEFPKMREYLVKNVGYQDKEVAIITGATAKKQRDKIQEDFNAGKIKVILGSSAIQEGMNLQENTSDMYLLSLPYNFTALRQTEGRAWRRGNKWENVRINYMLTNDSIDVFMLQTLQNKQARYMEAMKKGANVLDVSDVNTEQLKTALITDPNTRAEIEIEVAIKKVNGEQERLKADIAFNKKLLEKRQNATGSELDRIIKKMQERGITLENLVDSINSAQQKYDELEQRKDFLKTDELFRLAEKYEKEKSQSQAPTLSDFIAERKEENKTFFKVVEKQEREENLIAITEEEEQNKNIKIRI